MTEDPSHPKAWANFLVTAWGARFPVDVEQIALEYSKRYSDAIKAIEQAPSEEFEGALYPLRKIQQWAILYNPLITSVGRRNFTLAHELGHYLLHRRSFPDGLRCGEANLLGYDRDLNRRKIEEEADIFASFLLMPMNDFREQVRDKHMTLDLLRFCAERYRVSFTAAALKWLDFTKECAALVVATNGFILWCRRSEEAKKRYIFFPKGMPVPSASGAATPGTDQSSSGKVLGPGIWSAQTGTREMTIFADSYEMTISLIIFDRLPERSYVSVRSRNRGI